MIQPGTHSDPRAISRFRTEMEAAARLKHANIVQIYEVGDCHGRAYCALEYVDGGSLEKTIAGTPLPARQAAALAETLAQAVDHAHQHGVIHRDLKPANVLLTADGIPKITDFGLAKQIEGDARQTQSGEILGTPSYMAPEQAEGKIREIGPPADVYASGAILYELLTGRPPFKGETLLETLEQVRSQEPVSPSQLQPKLPRDLCTICSKAMAKSPERRYARAGDLADDLRRFLDGKPIHARPVGQLERLWRWCRRNRAVATLITLVGGLLLAVAIGSMLAALSINAAGQEAAKRAEAETEAKEKAEQNFQHAFDAVDKYFMLVSERKELRAHGLEAVRRDLLRKAQQFYEQFIRERGEDASLQEPLMIARYRLAVLTDEIDSPAAAIPLYQQALALADQVARAHPEVVIYQTNVARIHSALGSAFRTTGRLDEAEAAILAARDILEQLVQDHPTVALYRMHLARTLANLSGLYRETNRLSKAEPMQRR
jgi:serine/threonine-protein kinase